MHTIQHAALLATGGKIDFEHLPVAIRGEALAGRRFRAPRRWRRSATP